MPICQSTLIEGLFSESPQLIPNRKPNSAKPNPVKVAGWSAMLLVSLGYACFATNVSAQSPAPIGSDQTLQSVPVAPARATQEPVYRVAKVQHGENAGAAVAVKPAVIAVEPAAIRTARNTNIINASSQNSAGSKLVPAKLVSSASIVDSTPRAVVAPVAPVVPAAHPLDRAISMAKQGLAEMRGNVRDYSAIMVKRERINGVVGSQSCMKAKIRCPRVINGQQVPFSVYLKTLKPRKEAGREVIWTQGKNDNKLCAHETGLLGMKRFYLDPTGWVAMQNSRYPIMDAGLENLMIKLVEKAETAKADGHCVVTYRDNAEIMKRKCTVIELVNQKRLPSHDFHKAQVFIDTELNLPVRYASFDWPKTPGGEMEIIEEYTYVKINLNPGFSDIDFSADNPAYAFPRR